MSTDKYKILVDSSVWIAFFRTGQQSMLEEFIREDLVYTNELILTELLPAINHLGHNDAAIALQNVECIPLNIEWPLIRKYQEMNLKNGINKVGIPDLIIMQQAITEKLTLLSLDKHFQLMHNHFSFDLITQG